MNYVENAMTQFLHILEIDGFTLIFFFSLIGIYKIRGAFQAYFEALKNGRASEQQQVRYRILQEKENKPYLLWERFSKLERSDSRIFMLATVTMLLIGGIGIILDW